MTDHKGLPVKGYAPTQSSRNIAFVDRLKELEERYIRLHDEILDTWCTADNQEILQDQWLREGLKYVQIGSSLRGRAVFAPGRVTLPEDDDAAA